MALCCLTAVHAAQKTFTLVIDAGHGGQDTGALGAFSKEKNINLSVALAFGRYVEQNCPDVKVVYTRKTDVFIPLMTRAEIANKNKADLFVSVHTNALPKGKISRGLETYTLGMHRAGDNLDVAMRENAVITIEKDYKERYKGFDPNSSESYIVFEFMQDNNMAQSVEMAKLVQEKVCATSGRPNKGVKQAGFLVLRETSMPSCLIELGFITTPDEERVLNAQTTIDAIGRGIYQAFVAYKKKHDPTTKVPYRNERVETVDIPEVLPKQPSKQESPKLAEQKQQTQQEEVKAETPQPSTLNPSPSTTHPSPLTTHPSPSTLSPSLSTLSPQPSALNPPVFKVQIVASSVKLKKTDSQFKGLTGVDSYEEGGMTKYTVGASANYQEIYQLRKSVLDKFPQAFIIAFRGQEKMNVNEAIREYKSRKTKK